MRVSFSKGRERTYCQLPSDPRIPRQLEQGLILLTYLLLLLLHELFVSSKHFCHAGLQQLLQSDFRQSVAPDPVHLLAQAEEEALDVPGRLFNKTALLVTGAVSVVSSIGSTMPFQFLGASYFLSNHRALPLTATCPCSGI